MHLYTGAVWDKSEVLIEFELNLLQILGGILIGHVGRTNVELKIGAKILKVVIIGKFCEVQRKREGGKIEYKKKEEII